jgi:hypothetical protein
MKTMTIAERFFWSHAGYSWNTSEGETKAQGRRRCAALLAEAEVWAADQGMTFTWEHDDCPDLSWMTEAEQAEPHEVLVCLARYADGSIAASLGGIVDPDRTYGRIVEAELASEAKHDCLTTLAEAI